MDNNIVTESKALRAKDKSADIDISSLAVKYIPPGTLQSAAEDYLKRLKFKIYPQNPGADGSFVVMCIYTEESMIPFSASEEIRIIFDVKNSVVSNIRGKLITRTL